MEHEHRKPRSYWEAAAWAEERGEQSRLLEEGLNRYGSELMDWINRKPGPDRPLLCALLHLTREALRGSSKDLAEAEDALLRSRDFRVILTTEEGSK